MRKLQVATLLGGALLAAAPAHAASTWPVSFNNVCTAGAYRVCASSNVTLAGNVLTLDFWNNERVHSGTGADAAAAAKQDPYGQRSTITAIALYHNPTLPVSFAVPTLAMGHCTGSGINVSCTPVLVAQQGGGGNAKKSGPPPPPTMVAPWKLGENSIGNIAGVEIEPDSGDVAAGTNGNAYGIVGCNDPKPGSSHLETCATSSLPKFVRFTFTFAQADADKLLQNFTSNDLQMRFHAQQLWDGNSVKCDTGSSTEHQCMPDTTVTPEPATLALLGTGLAGLAGIRRRRRRATEEPEA